MKYYSASYNNTKDNTTNFVVRNLDASSISEFYPFYCVVQNLLQRGTPTKPSKYLNEHLAAYPESEIRMLLQKGYFPQWHKTIKGFEETQDYPAYDFFYSILPEYLSKEYEFVAQLILPEAPFAEITEQDIPGSWRERKAVDFYLPQIRKAIEIDGTQHELQKKDDKERDLYLKRNEIDVVRFKVSDIKNKNVAFKNKMDSLVRDIKNHDNINAYKNHINDIEKHPFNRNLAFEKIMRFQILVLELLKLEKLDLNSPTWEFSIIDDTTDTESLFVIACNDIFLWLENLFVLKGIIFKRPSIAFRESEHSVRIDISLFKRWSDSEENKDTIYIRNDYLDDKDYFKISYANPIKYNVDSKNSNHSRSLLFFLENIFGYAEYTPGQIRIIENILNSKTTLGILPTGSGKSLCYQMACLLQPCISFIVCPIVALIQDQKDNLNEFQITRTERIFGEQPEKYKEKVLQEYGQGKYLFIWISPERFQMQTFRDKLAKINRDYTFGLAVIDEAHCMSEWGHDFRTAYLTLIDTIKKLCSDDIPLLGLTATASPVVVKDLMIAFGIESKKEGIRTTVDNDRKNLFFAIVKVDNDSQKKEKLFEVIERLKRKYETNIFDTDGVNSRCGIVFTPTTRGTCSCERISKEIRSKYKTEVGLYYSKLNDKSEQQKKFMDNTVTLMVATKAFGMGINKKNIRYTIHYGMPWSIESFYQEAGRAGRDKNKAYCFLLFQPENNSDIAAELFKKDTSIKRINELQKSLHGDLNTLFYLWMQNKFDIEVEADLIIDLYIKLEQAYNKGTGDIPITRDDIKQLFDIDRFIVRHPTHKNKYSKPSEINNSFESLLYRLFLLGCVKDWTVQYKGELNRDYYISFVPSNESNRQIN